MSGRIPISSRRRRRQAPRRSARLQGIPAEDIEVPPAQRRRTQPAPEPEVMPEPEPEFMPEPEPLMDPNDSDMWNFITAHFFGLVAWGEYRTFNYAQDERNLFRNFSRTQIIDFQTILRQWKDIYRERFPLGPMNPGFEAISTLTALSNGIRKTFDAGMIVNILENKWMPSTATLFEGRAPEFTVNWGGHAYSYSPFRRFQMTRMNAPYLDRITTIFRTGKADLLNDILTQYAFLRTNNMPLNPNRVTFDEVQNWRTEGYFRVDVERHLFGALTLRMRTALGEAIFMAIRNAFRPYVDAADVADFRRDNLFFFKIDAQLLLPTRLSNSGNEYVWKWVHLDGDLVPGQHSRATFVARVVNVPEGGVRMIMPFRQGYAQIAGNMVPPEILATDADFYLHFVGLYPFFNPNRHPDSYEFYDNRNGDYAVGEYDDNTIIGGLRIAIAPTPPRDVLIQVEEIPLNPPVAPGNCARGEERLIVAEWQLFSVETKEDGRCFQNVIDFIGIPRHKEFEAGVTYGDALSFLQDLRPTVRFMVYVEETDSFKTVLDPGNTRLGTICLYDGHYFIGRQLFELDPSLKRCYKCKSVLQKNKTHNCFHKQCPTCKRWRKNLDKHVCNKKDVHYHEAQIVKESGTDRITSSLEFYETLPTTRLVIFDFETYSDEKDVGKQVVYAAGCYDTGTGAYQAWYGPNSLDDFYEYFDTICDDIILVGFFNSGFDNILLLEKMNTRERPDSRLNVVVHNSLIIAMDWKRAIPTHEGKPKFFKRKVMDISRFLGAGTSLANACKSFNLEHQKGSFPHRFVTLGRVIADYEGDVPAKHYWPGHEIPSDATAPWNMKQYCLKYLKLDVLSTAELVKTLREVIHSAYYVDLTEFITLNAMSYAVFVGMNAPNTNKHSKMFWPFESERPTIKTTPIMKPSRDEYEACVQASHGGRCYNTIRHFRSEQIEQIEQGKGKFEDITSYEMMADVISLYGAAMKNHRYGVGPSTWLTEEGAIDLTARIIRNPSVADALIPHGIFQVDFEAPDHLLNPILPTKEFKRVNGELKSQGLHWEIGKGKGWYSSIDLKRALRVGYKLNFHRGFFYEETKPIFAEYISICFKIKAKAELEGKQALREAAKLMANALYGKTLQKVKNESIAIARTSGDFQKLFKESSIEEIVDIVDYEDSQLLGIAPTYLVRTSALDFKADKPCHLGPAVLAYSREIITELQNMVDGHLSSSPDSYALASARSFFYTDTDSLHMQNHPNLGKNVEDIWAEHNRWGNGVIGNMANDDKKGGKVYEAIYLGPKTYMVRLIRPDNSIETIMKCKGVPRHQVKEHWYYDCLFEKFPDAVQLETLRRSIMPKDREEYLNVRTATINRGFLQQLWEGRHFFKSDNFDDKIVPFESIPYSNE